MCHNAHFVNAVSKSVWLCVCRAAVKAVVDRLMSTAFVATTRSLMERDKAIYCLLLALEVSKHNILVYNHQGYSVYHTMQVCQSST